MSDLQQAKVQQTAARHGLPWMSRVRAWWRRRNELDTFDRCELERIAGDLGIGAGELKELAARGPHAADQLQERMRLLALTRSDVGRLAPGLMWDLERTCARCSRKRICSRDLTAHPDDAAWRGYCPNATALTAVAAALPRFPTP